LAVLFYNIFLWLLRAGTAIASLFNSKARKWVFGRKKIFEKLEAAIQKNEPVVWMHCASLGEFEQGRPVIEQIKVQYPSYKILLTFFSPSGYEAQKSYKDADWVFYLPVDGPKNAKRFLEIVQPSLVIFVKYEFWYYYLKKIKYRNIPLLLISALFRKDMSFFKWYGGLQRKMLSRFDHLFVQNKSSKELVDSIGLADICTVSGDTRFDRVIAIAENFQPIPAIEQFIDNKKTIIAGSTWAEDEKVLQKIFTAIRDPALKLIIAPHEINEKRLKEIKELFPDAVLFSELPTAGSRLSTTLIIDNIGMLSKLYKYSYISYVGGALKIKGVHNVLEAAVYNKIVLFGPYYKKYSEAVGLIESGGGISFDDSDDCKKIIDRLMKDDTEYNLRSKAAGNYVHSNKGATKKIIEFIQEKRLLTN
jgi:3-deoxy-D-manno-octulosonic-acid transferase